MGQTECGWADGGQMEGRWIDKQMGSKREAVGRTSGQLDKQTGGEGRTSGRLGGRIVDRADGVRTRQMGH